MLIKIYIENDKVEQFEASVKEFIEADDLQEDCLTWSTKGKDKTLYDVEVFNEDDLRIINICS